MTNPNSSNVRAAGLVCQKRNGQLLFATHVPAKAHLTDDYSVTTITAHVSSRGAMLDMQEALHRQLGVRRQDVVIQPIVGLMESHGGKRYIWQHIMLAEGIKLKIDKNEIQQLNWNPAKELISVIEHMSEGRRAMFVEAVKISFNRGWFGHTFPRDVLGRLVQKTQPMKISA